MDFARGQRALTSFAAAMARGRIAAAERAIASFRRAGWKRPALEETALMLVLHAGYPAALEALRIVNARWPGRARRTPEGDTARWRRRGEQLCRRVYGAQYERLIDRIERLHPVMAVWIVEHGYGRVLSRPLVESRTRELIAVAVLAATGWERQLVSHLYGARNLGCARAAIRTALQVGARFADAAGRAAARRAWNMAFG